MNQTNWVQIKPQVNEYSEFLEIASDFGDPLEVVREAISNSFDAGATYIKIAFSVQAIDGYSKLIIEFEDDGMGMSNKVLEENFWALGNSASKNDKNKIGEKGHGTKIFLRSERVYVITHHETGSFESICVNPFKELNAGRLHQPDIRPYPKADHTGTYIRLEGYNNDERSRYLQDIVTDYIYWFTKLGSFEGEFDGKQKPNFKVYLRCLDAEDYNELCFGHKFAKENDDIEKLFEEYNANAIDYYVKKFSFPNRRLEDSPEVKYDAVIYVEGNLAKQEYNALLRKRKVNGKGYYKVQDRYGIWLSKDFIPIQKVNDWIGSFGAGSSSFTLLHGFINCQSLKLTANRGSIANTEPQIITELKEQLKEMLEEIDELLYKKEINTIQKWQQEEKTLKVENVEFKTRKESISRRKVLTIGDINILEPQNESELFGVFITLYTLFPDKFEFEPLDYKTSQGIDIIARNKTKNKIADCEFWYIELKYLLGKSFNHSLSNIRWIVCWDFEKDLKHDTLIQSLVQNEERTLKFATDNNAIPCYFLDSPNVLTKIKIIRLKEFIEETLKLKFVKQ